MVAVLHPVFATPDFGAGAAAALLLGCVWIFVLALAGVALWIGANRAKSDRPGASATGILLIVFALGLPLSCCFGPSLIVRYSTGNFPVGAESIRQIHEGMAADDVREALGTPHDRREDEERGDVWYYWMDAYGLRYFRVHFDPEGRVVESSTN